MNSLSLSLSFSAILQRTYFLDISLLLSYLFFFFFFFPLKCSAILANFHFLFFQKNKCHLTIKFKIFSSKYLSSRSTRFYQRIGTIKHNAQDVKVLYLKGGHYPILPTSEWLSYTSSVERVSLRAAICEENSNL